MPEVDDQGWANRGNEEPGGWTLETLRLYLESELGAVRILLHERNETQTKALETAFEAQQAAVKAALMAEQQMTHAALLAQEKAITKAEAASEKRFDSVNEFRAQLADQANTFMPRAESQSRHEANTDKLTSVERAISGLATRNEMVTATASTEEKVKDLTHGTEKRFETLLAQLNANALAIERATAAGQTIYVLRGEANTAAQNIDDKIQTAITVAASNHKLVIDSLGELRAIQAEHAARFMPRTEAETRTDGTTERLREIEIRMQSYPSRDETAVALSAADAKFAAGVTSITEKADAVSARVAALDLRLTSRLDLATGAGKGKEQFWGYAVAAITLIIGVILFANQFLGNP